MTDATLIYTTWPDSQSAEAAARVVVEKRLAACANVFPTGKSFYIWERQLESSSETVVIFKTAKESVAKLQSALIEMHPADCPCVIAIDIATGHKDFLNWVSENSK